MALSTLLPDLTNSTLVDPTLAPGQAPKQPIIVTVIFIIIGFVGTFGNALVCVVIASTLAWARSGTTNLLILNQAAVDTLTSVILILSYALPQPDIPETGRWAEFLCRMWVSHTLLWMLFVVSTFNLCMMSLERYIAVAFPVVYSTRFRKRTALGMIVFSWIVAPMLHYYYPVAFDYNDNGTCSNRGKSAEVAAIGVTLFIWEFFIPFVIMTVVYTRIVFLLRKQHLRVMRVAHDTGGNANSLPRDDDTLPRIHIQKPPQSGANTPRAANAISQHPSMRHGQGKPPSGEHNAHRGVRALSETLRRNVTITLLSVFVMYVICWMPNHLTFLQFGLGGPLNLSGAWYYITLVLAYLNMSINPFIYALKYNMFKQGFRRLFCRTRCVRSLAKLRRERTSDHSVIGHRSQPTPSPSNMT